LDLYTSLFGGILPVIKAPSSEKRSSAAGTGLDVAAIADIYFEAWRRRDPVAITELHAPESQFWLHLGTEPVRGREAIEKSFSEIFERFPEFGFETYRVIYGPAHWVLDWALTSVLAGGEPIRFDCLDIVTLTRAGLVDRKDTFVDMVQLNAALGTNP